METTNAGAKSRAAAAGVATGARRLLLVALLLALALPLSRCIASVYVRGAPFASPTSDAPSPYRDMKVYAASPEEAEAVRAAAAGLRYRVDPSAVDVTVIDDDAAPLRQAGEYLGGGDIRLKRSVIQVGGPALSWALAHEFGHYVDETYMIDGARERFYGLRGISEGLTWYGLETSWEQRPLEDFADVFAARAQDPPASSTTTRYGRIDDPTAQEEVLADVGVRPGADTPLESPAETVSRDAALYADFLARPVVAVPLAAAALAYILFGAVQRTRRTWCRLAA